MKHFSPKKILIWVMFLILFYTIFTYYSDLEKIQNHLANVSVVYFIPLFCILTVSIMLRSIFQYLLLNNLGIKISFRDNLKIFFVGLSMLITPGGSGVLIKSYFLKKKYGYAITKTLPAVFMERYFELIGIITIIIFSLLFVYSYQSTIIVLVSITIVLVLFYIIKTKTLVKLLIKILKKIKPFKTVIGEEDEIIESLGSFLKVKFLMKALTAIILITFLESTMFYLGFLSFNIDLDYINSIQIFYTSILFGSLLFIPGGIGATEGLFVTLLMDKNVEFSLASILIIFLRFVTIWALTGIGFVTAFRFILKLEHD